MKNISPIYLLILLLISCSGGQFNDVKPNLPSNSDIFNTQMNDNEENIAKKLIGAWHVDSVYYLYRSISGNDSALAPFNNSPDKGSLFIFSSDSVWIYPSAGYDQDSGLYVVRQAVKDTVKFDTGGSFIIDKIESVSLNLITAGKIDNSYKLIFYCSK